MEDSVRPGDSGNTFTGLLYLNSDSLHQKLRSKSLDKPKALTDPTGTSRNVLRPHLRPQPLNQRHNIHRITSIQSSFNHKQDHLIHLQLHRPHHDLDTIHRNNGHPTNRNRPNNLPEPANAPSSRTRTVSTKHHPGSPVRN